LKSTAAREDVREKETVTLLLIVAIKLYIISF